MPGDCDGDGSRHELECGGDDCDDEDGDRRPGNAERCDAEGHDEDCNPASFAGESDGDLDGDGAIAATCCNGDACGPDCDDTDVNVNPSAAEVCDGLDNDCSGAADDGVGLCPGGSCIGGRCVFDAWTRTIGGTGADLATSVAMDASEAIYVAGVVRGTVNFGELSPRTVVGAGPAVFVVKYAPDASLSWVYVSPGGNVTHPRVAVSPDGTDVYVTSLATGIDFGSGLTEGGYLLRLGGDGAYRGDARFAATFESIAADDDGVIVGGQFSRTADFGGGPRTPPTDATSMIVVRFDESGAFGWDAPFDVSGSDPARQASAEALEITSPGEIRVGGSYLGGPMAFGASSLPAAPSTRPFGFVAALTADGAPMWGRALTSPSGRVDIRDIAVSSSGRTYVAGSFTNDLVPGGTCTWFDTAGASSGATCDAGHAQDDGFIAAFDAAGAPDWARSFGGADGYDYAYGVATDSAGNVLVVGSFEAATNFGGGLLADPPARSDAFVVQYSATGLHTRDSRYSSGGDTFVRGVAVGPGNSTALVGEFAGTVDFGAGPRVSSGNTDAFVVRLGS